MKHSIPNDKLCDSGCGSPAMFFSENTGRYRCLKSSNSCPANRFKNSNGLKVAHKEGRIPNFTAEHVYKSQVSFRRNLVKSKPFEELGSILRKKIVKEEQNFKCLRCDLAEWMGLKITLELDHIDGNRYNNLRSNLRCLCPNCHSITDTWKVGCSVGKKVRKCSDEEIIAAYVNTGSISATLKTLNMNWGSHLTIKKVLLRYKIIE